MNVDTNTVRCTPEGLIYKCHMGEESGILYISETICLNNRVNIFVGENCRFIPDDLLIFEPSDFYIFLILLWIFMATIIFLKKLHILF